MSVDLSIAAIFLTMLKLTSMVKTTFQQRLEDELMLKGEQKVQGESNTLH